MAMLCNCMYPPNDPRCCMNKTAGPVVGSVVYEPFSGFTGFAPPPPLPHRCPVCFGKGNVPGGFYSVPVATAASTTTMASVEECRSCKGRGIVWKDG